MNLAPYKFMLRGFLILSPVFLFIIVCEGFLALCGETTSISQVASRHVPGGSPAIYAPMFFGTQVRRLQMERVMKLRPEVLVLGSSRVERFRSEMFAAGTRFYNASQTIRGVDSLREFVESLPKDYAPKAVLIGVDCWWLNREAQSGSGDDWNAELQRDDTRMVNAHVRAWQNLVGSVFRRSIGRTLLLNVLERKDDGIRRYGAGAWTEGGYRNDGSSQALDRKTPSVYRSDLPDGLHAVIVKSHTKRGLVPAAGVDPALLQQLEAVLQTLAQRGTRIVGFAPPYDSKTLSFFASHPADFGILPDFRHKISQLFQANGWSFYDGTDPSALGLDDRCMQELYHAMETYHVALLRRLGQDENVGRALHLDLPYLQSLLDDPRTTPAYPYYPPKRLEQAFGDSAPDRLSASETRQLDAETFPVLTRCVALQAF